MIDAELAVELQPMLCVAISSLLVDEDETVVTRRPLHEFGALAERLQTLGGDVAILASAMAVIARRTSRGADIGLADDPSPSPSA